MIVLRAGIKNAFFRFYYDAADDRARVRVVRTSFWFTMTSATVGLVVCVVAAGPISDALGAGRRPRSSGFGGRSLGAHELRAADVALPRRAALVSYAIASVATS